MRGYVTEDKISPNERGDFDSVRILCGHILRPGNSPVNPKSFDWLWNSKSVVGGPAHGTRTGVTHLPPFWKDLSIS